LGEFVKPHGSELRVFHDYNVLEDGQDWPAQTRQPLVGSKLLLPIITPRYFKSVERCRMEDVQSEGDRTRCRLRTHSASRHQGSWFQCAVMVFRQAVL